jgi:hypothetical protein
MPVHARAAHNTGYLVLRGVQPTTIPLHAVIATALGDVHLYTFCAVLTKLAIDPITGAFLTIGPIIIYISYTKQLISENIKQSY